jgi:hypothetical protein
MKDEMDGECNMHGQMRTAYNISADKCDGKRPLGIQRYRLDISDLGQDAVANSCNIIVNNRVP